MKTTLKVLFVASISIVSLTSVTLLPVAAVDTPDEQFVVPLSPSGDRYTALYVQDNGALRNPVVKLEAKDSLSHTANHEISSLITCKQIGEHGCDLNKYLQFDTVLSRCDNLNNHDCVNSVCRCSDNCAGSLVGRHRRIVAQTTSVCLCDHRGDALDS